MTVQRVAVPEACHAALRHALEAQLLVRPANHPAITARTRVGSPLPRLDWSPATLRDHAPRREWLFPLVGGEEPAFAVMVDPEGLNQWAYAGLRTGSFACRLFEACVLAEQHVEPSVGYEPRLVELHDLHFAALWLFSPGSDLFVSLLEGLPKGSGELVVEQGLERALVDLAETRARRAVRTTTHARGE